MRTTCGLCPATLSFAILLAAVTAADVNADDEKAGSQEAEARLKVMRGLIEDWTIEVKGEKEDALTFAKDPVFRYNDPARGLLDGAVWRLGEKGRPRAYVTMEFDRPQPDRDRVTYEFLALSGDPFTMSGRAVAWQPQDTCLDFKAIPDAQKPAGSTQRRLLQMKQLSRRFSAEQLHGREEITLRLIPRPIDRYKPNDADDSDAAVFIFAYGVNPEVLLFIETDGKDWSFACGRLAGAHVTMKLGDEQVWSVPKMGEIGYRWTNNYTANRHSVQIPASKD